MSDIGNLIAVGLLGQPNASGLTANEAHEIGERVASRVAPLDAAWAEAEAALPEGWTFGSVGRSSQRGQTKGQAWIASAWGFRLRGQGAESAPVKGRRIAYGSTPVAALRALAAKLGALTDAIQTPEIEPIEHE
jgi:hypothetical protein